MGTPRQGFFCVTWGERLVVSQPLTAAPPSQAVFPERVPPRWREQ